jgi:hypothetical protein
MFDSLSQMMQQGGQQQPIQQPQRQQPLIQHDAMGLAGMLILGGMKPQDAYVQGAKMAREEEYSQYERQKQQAEQMQRQQYSQLADYVRNNPNVSNQELAGAAMQLGVNPANIPAFLGALGAEDKVVQDSVYGPTIFRKHAGSIERDGQQQINTNPNMDTSTTANGINTPPPLVNRVEAREKYKSDLRKDERKEKENAEYNKELAESSSNATDLLEQLDTMKQLIPNVFTAPFAESKYSFNKTLGINPEKTADYELFKKYYSDMVFDLLSTQKGVQTNEDRKEMAKTKPGPENTEEGNMAIAKSMEAMLTRRLEHNIAVSEYMKQGGSKTEFEKIWRTYAKKHPLLSKDKKGILQINENNLYNWRKEIFGQEMGETQEEPTLKTQPLSDEELISIFKNRKRK